MNNKNYFSIKFPSRSANEGFARAAVSAFVTQLDPTLEEINDIKTAVSEAVTNCIVHAYKDKIGLIYITCEMTDDGCIKVKIKDKGCGIPDIKAAMQPLFTTIGGERAGLGFAVMESFSDNIRVISNVNKGTTVVLTKKIKPRISTNVKK